MSNSEPEGNIGFLLRFLKFAQKTHPVVKLATIVAGFAVAAAIVVAALGRNQETVIIVGLMLLAALVVYPMAKLVESKNKSAELAGLFLLWAAILFFCVFLVLSVYAVIECKPRAWVYVLGLQAACESKKEAEQNKTEAPYDPSITVFSQASPYTAGGFNCMRVADNKPAALVASTTCAMSGLQPCTTEVQSGYCLIVYGPHASTDRWTSDEVRGETWQCYRNGRPIGERIERPGLGSFSAAARTAVCARILTNSIDRKAGGS